MGSIGAVRSARMLESGVLSTSESATAKGFALTSGGTGKFEGR